MKLLRYDQNVKYLGAFIWFPSKAMMVKGIPWCGGCVAFMPRMRQNIQSFPVQVFVAIGKYQVSNKWQTFPTPNDSTMFELNIWE